MDNVSPSPSLYAQSALSHAQKLAASPRGSATAAEKQAADYVQAQLNSAGFQGVQVQPFTGERSIWLFVALAFGLALVGHAAYWLLCQPAGYGTALVISLAFFAFSGYLIWRKFTLEDYPLHRTLPHGASQNVIATIPPIGETQGQVVLVAHLDSHRAVFWFASDFMVRLFGYISIITIAGVYAAIPVYLLAALTPYRVFTWLGILLAAFHFLGWFTGITADLGRYSPGANDNASSVGTLLALADRLTAQPLQNTEICLAFTGCEESSGDGMLAFIKQRGVQLKQAVFIYFEMVGIGDGISYIREEGNLSRYTIPQELEAVLLEVGKGLALGPVSTPFVGASTECSILLKFGYKAACLVGYCHGSSFLPQWHRLTDTPDRLQVEALERIHLLAWDLLQRFDQRGV